MAIEAVVNLDTLRCVSQHDGAGAEPYLWTALTWVEFEGGQWHFGSSAPRASTGARAVVKDTMKAGQRANIPSGQRQFTHRFGDGVMGGVGIVVALLEEDELDFAEVKKGYTTFLRELDKVVGGFVEANDRQPDEDELDEMAATIERRVERAIKSAVSGWEKLGVALGFVNPDDTVGFASQFWPVFTTTPSRPFALNFKHTSRFVTFPTGPSGSSPTPVTVEQVTEFNLDGRVQLRTPAPTRPTFPVPPLPRPRPIPVPRPRSPGTSEP
jgi:hypothetical protein